MNKGYRIAGYLGVKIDSNKTDGSKIKFILTPLQKYLSPDNEYAVGYQITKNNTDCEVKLFSLHDGKLECEVSDDDKSNIEINNKIENLLIQLALDQKKVLVYIMEDNKIVGFEYPVS
jgi:hypothetical protein